VRSVRRTDELLAEGMTAAFPEDEEAADADVASLWLLELPAAIPSSSRLRPIRRADDDEDEDGLMEADFPDGSWVSSGLRDRTSSLLFLSDMSRRKSNELDRYMRC
jgi:hypothetical protein